MLVRMPTDVRSQPVRALPPASTALATSAAAASTTSPTRSSGRAGLSTLRALPPRKLAATIGPAFQRCGAANGFLSASIRASVMGSVRSNPLELRRPAPKMLAGGGDRRIGGRALRQDALEWIMHDVFRFDRLVDDLVHEGGVCAVLEQAANEIGEQLGMRAHRRIDPTACALGRSRRLVQALRPCRAAAGIQSSRCFPPSPE